MHSLPPPAPAPKPTTGQRAAQRRREEHVLAIIAACQQRQLQLTASRLRVLRVLAEDEAPMKAYAILDVLRRDTPNTAPPAVYRALEFLQEQGWLVRLNSINAYLLRPPGQAQACTYLVCEHCEGVASVAGRHLMTGDAGGFVPSNNTVEITGTCSRCRANGGAGPPGQR